MSPIQLFAQGNHFVCNVRSRQSSFDQQAKVLRIGPLGQELVGPSDGLHSSSMLP